MEVLVVKLDKRDIEAVATSRFSRKVGWKFVTGMCLIVGMFIGSANLWSSSWGLIPPLILGVAMFIW